MINIKAVAIVLLWGIFLSPAVQLVSGTPKIRLDDFLIGIVLLWIILTSHQSRWIESPIGNYLGLLFLFCCWILATILVNDRIAAVIDYFEIYKLVKYSLVFYLFFRLGTDQKFSKIISTNIIFIFVLLIVFNLLNLNDIASFNTLVMPVYAPEHHLESIESQASNDLAIRMLGTMGNPNTNAMLWGVMVAILVALRAGSQKSRLPKFLAVLVAVIMCMLSQSRTTLIALAAGLLMYQLFSMRLKNFGFQIIASLLFGFGTFAFINMINLSYLSSLWEIDMSDNNSWLLRLEIWEYLYKMIEQSPWFGYGPNKDFFYSNTIYSDNEYILIAWRYGYFGVVLYLAWVMFPLIHAKKLVGRMEVIWARAIVIMVPLFLVSAISNNPMSEPRLSLLFAAISGLMFAEVELFRKKAGFII